jgi:predicted O-methyltransferase YrrM
MDTALTALLDELARFGDDNDARETERPKRMLNITPDTGRLLSILIRSAGATRVLEVGTSNAYSTIWLADVVRETGGRVTTLESNPGKVTLARANLAPHLAVHLRRGGEMLLRLLALARAPVEPAEAEVAVGDVRT